MLELKIVSWSDQVGAPVDWRVVSEESLRYDHFLGDVTFRVEEADFTTTWGWVPVLDFATSLTTLLDKLRPGRNGVFEFTESEDTLHFRREEDLVEVSASYADGLAVVAYIDLWLHAQSVLSDLTQKLRDRHPELGFNPAFLRIASLPAL